jgi:hypothetical protein
MWICLNDGFLSVVADKNDRNMLMVRARRKIDLTNIFGSNCETIETPEADYRWRTFIERKAFIALVTARVMDIDYTNFKDSVDNNDLHDMYLGMWSLHSRYGKNDPATR